MPSLFSRRLEKRAAGMTTESVLKDWRFGQAQAERLTAALLHLEDSESVDPQHPLGGPDGLKDVLCQKSGILWVAAAYFPPTQARFPDIRQKFEHDLVGVAANQAKGFAFFVNQHLTVGERQELVGLSTAKRTEVYHLKRISNLLNAPKGCGIRLEYLRIPMTEPEQLAFWSTMNTDIVRKLADNERMRVSEMGALERKIDLILARTSAIHEDLHSRPSSLSAPGPIVKNMEMPTALLSMTMVCWLHRVITEGTGLQEAVRGRFRAVQMWIGGLGSTLDDCDYVPAAPEKIEAELLNLLAWWRSEQPRLRSAESSHIVNVLADLHHRFLRIHPFLDANGRLARVLLDQAARELLNKSVGSEFTADPKEYYEALRLADAGDLTFLSARLMAALQ